MLAPAPTLTVVAQDDAEIRQLRQEVAGMRQVIEREMNRFTDERLRGSPVRATALDLMDEYGFDAGLARDVAMQIPLETEAHRGRGLMLGLISRKLPIAPVDPLEEGGVIALVGPTGAGKTTTIAKLASRFAEKHAPRDVALVTTDTTRIGAREQLYGYGRQLGIAVHEANSGTDLDQLLERLKDYKLVLIDTAGLGPRDRAGARAAAVAARRPPGTHPAGAAGQHQLRRHGRGGPPLRRRQPAGPGAEQAGRDRPLRQRPVSGRGPRPPDHLGDRWPGRSGGPAPGQCGQSRTSP